MSHDQHETSETCPSCGFGTFTRNAYWMGKLMLPRDFIDEQRYFMDKLRHHTVYLHGWGVVCGLQVVPHENAACQSRFVCVEPGVAVDCCGYDIVLPEKECIDLDTVPAIQALKEKNDTTPHTLQICIRYRECPTEQVPVLYDDCGCETDRCAPNRILESYQLAVLVDPVIAPTTPAAPPCGDLWKQRAAHCELCDTANCVVLATIENYVVGQAIDNTTIKIDNDKGRKLLPSAQTIKEVIDCLTQTGGGPGLDGVDLKMIECGQSESSQIVTDASGKRILKLEIPDGCPPGIDDIDLKMVDCTRQASAQIVTNAQGKRVIELTIPSNCGQKLTHICSIGWDHGKNVKWGEVGDKGLVIVFDQAVQRDDLKQALVVQGQTKDGCWCDLPVVIMATGKTDKECDATSKFIETSDPQVTAFAFRVEKRPETNRCRILLKGDFLRDTNGRGVDGDHLPPWFPGPAGYKTGDGIEGGTFESWFKLV